MLNLNVVYRRKSSNFVIRKIENETVLVPLVSNVADMTGLLTLNEVATDLFEAFDGKNNLNSIITQLTEIYDVEKHILEKDVEEFIAQALKKNIIEEV